MRRTTRLAIQAVALLVLVFWLLPVPRGEVGAAQPPAPVLIADKKPHGEPERTELGEGRVKFVTRNAAGQIISETVIDGAEITVTHVESVYPDGKAAEVVTIKHTLPTGEVAGVEVVRYDSSGVPQERETPVLDGDTRRERWNPKSKEWETAPEKERWDPYKGRWETVPDNERFNPKLGIWERQNPETGKWDPVPQTDESILDEMSPSRVIASTPSSAPLQASARRGHAVAAEARAGLNTTIFSTPRGRLRVNLPDDIAAGDIISGTIYAEPVGKDQREQARNLTELRSYVVEWEKQKTTASSSGPSSGTPFTLAVPAAAATTRLILRNEDGDELARRDLQVVRPLPASTAFAIPRLAEKGNPITIRGPFDGDFRTSTVTVGGEVLPKLAESPRKIVAHNTTAQVGLSKGEVTEGSQTVSGEIRNVGIALSAPRLNLLRGEQTTVTVTVTGLEGFEEPVPLVLENMSPSIVRMSDGELQHLSIGPSQVQGGMYTTERTLSSIQTGTFTVTGTVTVGSEPLRTQTRERLKSETRADLAITKTASLQPGFISYTITITNNGRNGAESVVVTDHLPPQISKVIACVANATQRDEKGAGGSGFCPKTGNPRRITFPFLAVGATATIRILAAASSSSDPAARTMTNTAEVSSSTPDPDLSNNRSSVTTPLPGTTVTSTPRPPTRGDPPPPPPDPIAADLQITKMALPTRVKPGDKIYYSIVITNGGPHTAVAPLILDSIPTETTFVACTVSRGACRRGGAAGGLVDAVFPDMPNGGRETLRVEVDVKKDVAVGTAIFNDADVSSATPDLNPVNNKAMAVVWVGAPLPLVVISEFRTRGPRGEKDEFIELYNRSNQRLDLGGWTLAVSNGSGTTTTLLTIAPGTLLPARSHLLLANVEDYSSVPADQTFSGDIADDGGIALRPLRGIPGDEVGMSNGSAFREGAVLTPMLTNADQSYERRPAGPGGSPVDSNNNRADFRVLTPSTPQNRGGTPP